MKSVTYLLDEYRTTRWFAGTSTESYEMSLSLRCMVTWYVPGGTTNSCFHHKKSVLNSSPCPTKKSGVFPFNKTASRSAPSIAIEPNGPETFAATASRATSRLVVFPAVIVTVRVTG